MPHAVNHGDGGVDWLNAETCLENAQIAYEDSLCDEDGPVDTVISSGDLGVLIGLAEYAVKSRAALQSLPLKEVREALEKAQEALVFAKNWMRTECMMVPDCSLILGDVEGALAEVTAALSSMDSTK